MLDGTQMVGKADRVRQAGLSVPAVSIVIPAFNAAAFIRDALDSVAAQTYQDYEIIVVDDGSDDLTVERIKEWSTAHPEVPLRLFHHEHQGISAARNAGIQESRGSYVAFLDADDLWTPRKLEAVMACLEKPSPADLVCHDEWLEEGGGRKGTCRHGPYSTYADLLFRGNCISTSAVVVRRNLVLQVGGFSPKWIHGMEDYDLWLRLAEAGCRIAYVHENLGVYRRLGQGISNKVQPHYEEGLAVLAAHYDRWKRKSVYARYLMRKHRAAMLRGASRSLLQCRAHHQARRFWRRALAEDPLSWKTWFLGLLSLARVRL